MHFPFITDSTIMKIGRLHVSPNMTANPIDVSAVMKRHVGTNLVICGQRIRCVPPKTFCITLIILLLSFIIVFVTISIYKAHNKTTAKSDLDGVPPENSFWSFDNHSLDDLSIYDGIPVNSPVYITPGISGHGASLLLLKVKSQYISITKSRNISSRNFTVSFWFLSKSLSTDCDGLFSYHDASNGSTQSLHLGIINRRLYFTLTNGEILHSSVNISNGKWYHVAFTYDALSSTFQLYLNGNFDQKRSGIPHGVNLFGPQYIGRAQHSNNVSCYFNGYIDHVSIDMYTKNSVEILDDATLTTWHSFDNHDSYYDSGPFKLNGTGNHIELVPGIIGHAIRFVNKTSWYQISGFIHLGIANHPYAIALWLKPMSNSGASLVHLSTIRNGQGACRDLLGFNAAGEIEWMIPSNVMGYEQKLTGPVLPVNIWNHVVVTFCELSLVCMYINGTLVKNTWPVGLVATAQVNVLTLGNALRDTDHWMNSSCPNQSIVPEPYSGMIDEFRVYSRRLKIEEISKLFEMRPL